MTSRWLFLGVSVFALNACTSATTADEEVAEDSEELRLCDRDAPVLADRTAGKAPILDSSDVTIAASLPYPPGNVAAAADGRIFVSMFPDTNFGSVKVGVLGANGLLPFPDAAFQDRINAVLGIRMDRHNRLFVLDHGKLGLHKPKLYAFDVTTGAKKLEIEIGRSVAPIGSMLNDVQISPDGKTAYISDAGLTFNKPAIVVVDLTSATPPRRVLERHPSVMAGKYDVLVNGEKAKIAGLFCADGGVDGIALDASGTWLYYTALDSGVLYRVPTSALRNANASPASAVEKVADTMMSDGMIADGAGNVYLTDMEHSAVVRVGANGLEVVAKDARFRWPDGMSWSPSGDLYLTASALHQTMKNVRPSKSAVERGAPYHVFKLKMNGACNGQSCNGVIGQ